MNTISGSTFNDTGVSLDELHYINCEFVNCNIRMSTGETSLEDCRFSNCTLEIVPGSPAHMAVEIYKMFNK